MNTDVKASPLDLDTPHWSSADLCAATGIDPTTLKNWIRSEPPVVAMTDEDRAASGSGGRHLFTLRRVLQIALIREFVEQGLAPRHGGLAASIFTELGGPGRPPGHLFPKGWTVLLTRRRRDTCAVNWDPEQTLASQFLLRPMGSKPGGTFVLVNSVYARVLRTLKLQPPPEAALVPALS